MKRSAGLYMASVIALAAALLTSCGYNKPPNQPLAEYVDMERFMGRWYVHGYTPTPIDKEAFNATETYEKEDDGRILTTYQFNKGAPDGKLKAYNPVGRVFNKETNSEWRMRFFGIFNAPYYIVFVDEAHEQTVIGHPNKKLAWIMTRSPEIGEDQFSVLRNELESRGYDLEKLSRVSHVQPSGMSEPHSTALQK